MDIWRQVFNSRVIVRQVDHRKFPTSMQLEPVGVISLNIHIVIWDLENNLTKVFSMPIGSRFISLVIILKQSKLNMTLLIPYQ